MPVLLKDSDKSKTQSAISEGTITVRNPDGANDLVGLNRDTANANQHLDRPDEKAMQERIDLIQSSAQLSSSVINTVAKAKADAATKLAREATTPEQKQAAAIALDDAKSWLVGGDKRLMADIASGLIAAGLGGATGGTAVGVVANASSSEIFKKIGDFATAQRDKSTDSAIKAAWDEGGAARILLHAMAGAAIGLSSGSAQSGALGAGASAALMPSIDQALAGSGMSKSERDAVASLIASGIGAAAGSGNGAGGAVVGGGAGFGVDKYNRQLHPDEKLLAQELAKKSKGKYTVEQIEAQMRLSSINGTDINAGTDVVASGTGIYDPDGNWLPLGDGRTFVQGFAPADRDVIAYIKDNVGVYSWTPEAETGYSRYLTGDSSSYPPGGAGKRDRLTGYALDEKGGYVVPVAIEGVVYTPRFNSCASAECVANGANIDLADINTLKWLRAAEAKVIADVSSAMAVGSIFASGGSAGLLSNGSSIASVLSGYLKDETPKAMASYALSEGFERYAISKGLSAGEALKVSNALSVMGVWGGIVDQAGEVFKED